MKILVFSDLHEEKQALDKLRNYAERIKPDFVLSCGDISRSVAFAEEVLQSFSNFYFVSGNWDTKIVNEYYATQKNLIHKKRVEINCLNIVGFGFSPITPFRTFGEKTEEEIEKEVEKLPIDNNTIFLLHAPPRGFFDKTYNNEHIGSNAIREIVKRKEPFACVFGHVHERIGFCFMGNSYFIKVPPAKEHKCAILHIENKKLAVEFIYL